VNNQTTKKGKPLNHPFKSSETKSNTREGNIFSKIKRGALYFAKN
jgi:hypothetical protein